MKTFGPTAEWAMKVFALALAYAAAGRIALLLAVPPGVATAAFPPAGIAMAAVLIWGYRVWPGVLVGALLLTLSPEDTAWDVARNALCIGLGSTLQALLGALLIRRLVGFPSAFDDRATVGIFVLLGGPVACLTSATWSIAGLWLCGFMTRDLLFNWFTWWIGDTIGVLVFLPLLLIAFGEPRDVWRKRWLSVGLPLTAAFAGSVLVFHLAEQQQRTNQQLAFMRQTNAIGNDVTERMESSAEVVHAVAMLFQSSSVVERDEFRRFVDRSLSRHPEIVALGWIPRVPAKDRTEFEQAAHSDASGQSDPHTKEGLQQFRIKRWRPDNQWNADTDTVEGEFFPVLYLEPYQGNEAALGIDLGSNPSRRIALDAARDSGHAAATPPILLAQEMERCASFLLVVPVYDNVAPNDTIEQRRDHLVGYASGVFRVRDIVEPILSASDSDGVELSVFDDSQTASSAVALFARTSDSDPKQFSGEQIRLQRNIPYEIGGRMWRLCFTPSEEYLSDSRRNNMWCLFAVACMLMISIAGTSLLVAGRSEATLRSSEQRFRSMFELAAVGMAQVAPDGTFIRVNQALTDILGYGKDELVGRNFRDFTHPDNLEADLENVQRLLDGTLPSYSAEKRYRCKDSSFVWAKLNLALVFDAENSPQYFISVIEDISQRRRAEDQLLDEQGLLKKLIELQEAERRMVALDIHDGVTQDIFGAQLHLQGTIAGIESPASAEKLQFVDEQLGKAIKECRRLITDLRPMILEEAGIVEAITHLVHDEQERSGLTVAFRSQVQFERLEPKLEGAMYRVIQEALSNVRQHGQVQYAVVEMMQNNGTVDITVRDSGIGFDKDQVSKSCFGLRGIHERARLFGGNASINSHPGEGTTVRVQLPLDAVE